MSTVFTNDSNYLTARDDLLAVHSFLCRKPQMNKQMLKASSSRKSERDSMAISG